ncbi:hypothetical protein SBRCBS47491_009114 [Sporothrix bragantina]|uniref:Glutathione S-transferase n=1 Tax=Sporothrix bragantina TaxID=671064 RepID=A0ABP0CVD2_9PEZI
MITAKSNNMAPKITLYHAERACSMVVLCLVRDLGLPFDVVYMRMGANGIESVDGTLNREKYLQIHPLGNVPCLVVDGQVITETPAILTYVAGLVPEKHLLGDTPVEQAWVHGWTAWLAGALHGRGFSAVFRPKKYSDDVSMHSAIQAKGLTFVKECYSIIEGRLAGRDYPVGNHETVVDFYLLIFYIWGHDVNIDVAKDFPAYSRLFNRMLEKEAVLQVDLNVKPAMVYDPEE